MASQATPKKLSVHERVKMMSGPQVDIYVGPQAKYFRLPKLLLCHYSPYFERCFNGKFKEGEEQKLVLERDNLEYFEGLLQYMLSGSTADIFQVKIAKEGTAAFKACFDFIQYADYFGIGVATEAVVKPLKTLLKVYSNTCRITGEHIELVFRHTAAGNPLRILITQVVLSQNQFLGLDAFRKQEATVEGFASELLLQIRQSLKGHTITWFDLLIDESRKNKC